VQYCVPSVPSYHSKNLGHFSYYTAKHSLYQQKCIHSLLCALLSNYQMFIAPWGSVTVFPCGSFDCLWLLSRKVTTWELPAVSPLPPTQASSVAPDLTRQNAPQTGTRIPWSAILILYLKFDSPNTSSQDIIYWLYLFIVLNCTTIWKGLLSF